MSPGKIAAEDPWTDDAPAVSSARNFRVVSGGSGYVMEIVDVPITFEFDRPRWERDSLFGQITVKTDLTGSRTFQGILMQGSFNVSAPGTRKNIATRCADLAKAPQIDWERLMEEFCIRVLQAESEGAPAVDLRTIPRSSATDASLDIHGFRVLERHPIILFGDGGTFKSYLALYLAGELARRGLSVLYADWELDGGDHSDRLFRLFGPDWPLVHYVRCQRPLTAEVDRLARLAAQHEAAYMVCDSVAFACDGPPEAAESAQRYFQCVRRIGVGSLHVAHINKSDESDRKPFGSAFWHNGARATWNVKQSSETTVGGSEIRLGFYNRKSNLSALMPAVGLSIRFDQDRTLIHPISLADVGGDLAADLPISQRMQRALAQPLTLAALSEEIGAKIDSINKAVQRNPGIFKRMNGADGVARIALVSSRRE
jgi:hypothetical protein